MNGMMGTVAEEIVLTDDERPLGWAVREYPDEGKVLYAATNDGRGAYHCHIDQVGGLIETLINSLDSGTRADLYAEIATRTTS